MEKKKMLKPLRMTSKLKSKANKLAHAAGLAHSELIRLQLLANFESRMNAGESQDAILAALELRAFTDADLASMTMTDADLAAMVLTDDELMARAICGT